MIITPSSVADHLTSLTGIKFIEQKSRPTEYITVAPADMKASSGFVVRVDIGWRNLKAQIVFGNYAADLIKTLEKTSDNKGSFFLKNYKNIVEDYNKTEFTVNGKPINELSDLNSLEDWQNVSLTLEQNHVQSDELNRCIISIMESITTLLLTLLPIQYNNETNDGYIKGISEGNLSRVITNKYEREPLNRMHCLRIHGYTCKVCEFDFKQKYGEIGVNFIHVHHVIPLSKLKKNYIPDPGKDLVPVCPNCHYMLYRKDPPYTVDELKEITENNEAK